MDIDTECSKDGEERSPEQDQEEDIESEPKRTRLTRAAAKKNMGGQNESEDVSAKKCAPPEPVPEERVTRTTGLTSYQDRVIKVGRDYQANIPEMNKHSDIAKKIEQSCFMLWKPTDNLSDSDIDEFCYFAREHYGFKNEQALGMLFFHDFNLEAAYEKLPSFQPHLNEWSTEEKVLFEQAFSFNGKNFNRIRNLLPDKSLASLVEYYYNWKKTRTFTSYMDRLNSNNESDSDSDTNSEGDGKVSHGRCDNCRTKITEPFVQKNGAEFCYLCHLYWKRCNGLRPCKRRPVDGEDDQNGVKKKGATCPENFELSVDALREFGRSTQPPPGMDPQTEYTEGDKYLKQLDYRVYGLKQKAVKNYRNLKTQYDEHNIKVGIEHLIPSASQRPIRPNPRWTEEEKSFAVMGFRRYGLDYEAISEILNTKSIEMVKQFYKDNQDKLGLKRLVQEYESQNEIAKEQINSKFKKETDIEEIIDLSDEDTES